ncbi:MAG: small subunit ribosomal protein S9 [Parcubacteria group bacterium Gr01-1014_38]|nr:MAG: small subunit ribosomal protein S9 [Parcubacteria group bacterium Gr01-1014_38]
MPDQARYVEGVGRRKTAVARVRLLPAGSLGGGKDKDATTFLINQRPWEEYFPIVALQTPVRQPFEITGSWGKFDVSVRVSGGGIHAQAGAVKLGIARALEKQEEGFRKPLRDTDMLTRDPREKERKKPGLKRARRAPQWQKR